jgi:hypothetical protein
VFRASNQVMKLILEEGASCRLFFRAKRIFETRCGLQLEECSEEELHVISACERVGTNRS